MQLARNALECTSTLRSPPWGCSVHASKELARKQPFLGLHSKQHARSMGLQYAARRLHMLGADCCWRPMLNCSFYMLRVLPDSIDFWERGDVAPITGLSFVVERLCATPTEPQCAMCLVSTLPHPHASQLSIYFQFNITSAARSLQPPPTSYEGHARVGRFS